MERFFWAILSLCFALQVSSAVMGGLIYFNERNNQENKRSTHNRNLNSTDMAIYDCPYDGQYLQASA